MSYPLRYLRSEKAVVRSEGGRAADPYSAGQASRLTTSDLRAYPTTGKFWIIKITFPKNDIG
jgi:hypothetical protein